MDSRRVFRCSPWSIRCSVTYGVLRLQCRLTAPGPSILWESISVSTSRLWFYIFYNIEAVIDVFSRNFTCWIADQFDVHLLNGVLIHYTKYETCSAVFEFVVGEEPTENEGNLTVIWTIWSPFAIELCMHSYCVSLRKRIALWLRQANTCPWQPRIDGNG